MRRARIPGDAAEAVKLVHEFADGKTEAEFNSNLLVRSAIERQLEILGVALNGLRSADANTSARVPDLDKIIGKRNIIAPHPAELSHCFGRSPSSVRGAYAGRRKEQLH